MVAISITAKTDKAARATQQLADKMQREFAKLKKAGKVTDETFDRLAASTAQLKRQMGDLSVRTRKASAEMSRMNRAGGKLAAFAKTRLGPALAGVAAVSTVRRFAAFTGRVVDMTEEMGILANAAGTTVENFSALSAMTATAGLSVQQTSKFLNDLNTRIAEFATSGTGTLGRVFGDLGLGNIADFAGMGSMDQLEAILRRAESMGKSYEDIQLLFRQINARAGGRFASLVRDAGSIEALMRELERVKTIPHTTQAEYRKAAEINRKWVEVAHRWRQMWEGPALHAQEKLVSVADRLLTAAERLGAAFEGREGLVDKLLEAATRLGTLTNPLAAAGGVVGGMIHDAVTPSAAERAAEHRREVGEMLLRRQRSLEKAKKRGDSEYVIGRWTALRDQAAETYRSLGPPPEKPAAKKMSLHITPPPSSVSRTGGGGETERADKMASALESLADRRAKEIEKVERLREDLDQLQSSFDPVHEHQKQFESGMETVSEAYRRGMLTQEQYAGMTDRLHDRLAEAAQALDPVRQRVQELSAELGGRFAGAVRQAIEGTHSLGAAFQQVILDMMLDWVESQISNMFGSVFSSLFGGIFGFAKGGRPPVGRPSVVGERGPELFVPQQAGTIVPNSQMGGGGGLALHIGAVNVTAPEGGDPAAFGAAFKRAIVNAVSDARRRGEL